MNCRADFKKGKALLGSGAMVVLLNSLLLQCYQVGAIEEDAKVSCWSNLNCNAESDDELGIMTARECCVGNLNGMAFTEREDNQTCTVCIVFGFFQDSFIDAEQQSSHSVRVGYQKGAAQARRDLDLKVEDFPGTASRIDYTLGTGRVTASYWATEPYKNLTLTFHQDRIAQEDNETLSLYLTPQSSTIPTGDGVFFRSSINVTIIDSDTLTIDFTEGDYRAREGSDAFMPVKVTKSSIKIATPIVLEIIPLTAQQANQTFSVEDNPYSPPFADSDDFSNATVRVSFDPDMDNYNELSAPIPIFDDDVDEANEQIFVVKLRLVSAVNADAITFTHDTSKCRIVDNDVIRFGFELPAYTYTEPAFEEVIDSSYVPKSSSPTNGPVFIVKENNAYSEQTFEIAVQVSSSESRENVQSATLGKDYRFNSSISAYEVLRFAPGRQKLNVEFTLLPDVLTEQNEAFLLSMSPAGDSERPTYSNPRNLSVESLVIIRDFDGTVPPAINTTPSSYIETTTSSTTHTTSTAPINQTTDSENFNISTSLVDDDEGVTTPSSFLPEGKGDTSTSVEFVTTEVTQIPPTSFCSELRDGIDDILTTTVKSQGLTHLDITKVLDQLASVVTIDESDIGLCSANETRSSFDLVSQVFSNITDFLLNQPSSVIDKIQFSSKIVNVSTQVIDSLLVWPSDAIDAEASSRLIQSFEIITSLYTRQLKNESTKLFTFSSITLVTELHDIEQLQQTGKSFRADNKTEFTMDSEKSLSPLTTHAPSSSTRKSSIVLPGAVFNNSLLRTENNSAIGVVFTLYKSPTLFPVGTSDNTNVSITRRVGTHVISANVGEDVEDLSEPVTINLQLNIQDGEFLLPGSEVCVSWDFVLHDWTDRGCKTIARDDGNVTCYCSHLTNFAVLMDVCLRQEDCQPVHKDVDTFLSFVSYIGISVSIVGLSLTIITMLAFKEVRKRETSKYHVQLSLALLLMLVMTLVLVATSAQAAEMIYGGCVTISVLVHYFALVAVMWMGAEALLMFQKVVIIFVRITTKFIVIISLVCWLVPVVAVVIPLAIDLSTSDDPDDDLIVKRNGTNSFCFLFHPGAFWGAFLGPILLILTLNIVSFVCVLFVLIRQVKRRKAMHRTGSVKRKVSRTSSSHNVIKDEPANAGMGYKKAIFLMIRITGVMALFGLSWLFAILTVISVKGLQEMFQILFTVFNSFQGCFIFIFLCLLDKRVRKSWKRLILKTLSRVTGKKYMKQESTLTSGFGMHSRDSTRSRSFRLTTVNSTTDFAFTDSTLPSTSTNGQV